MANRAAYEEAIRLYLETAGDEELAGLVKGLGDIGDAAEAGVGEARKAFDKLADTIEASAKVDAFVGLKRELGETERKLADAQTEAQKLFKTLASGEGVDSKVQRQQEAARKAVNDLSEAATKQRAELQRLRASLAESGISTTQLGRAQGELRARQEQARSELGKTVQSLRQYRQQSQQAARDIPATNKEIADSYGKVGGALQRLRSLAGPVLAFLSFRSILSGLRSVATEGSNAEQEIAQLNAALASTGREAEFNGGFLQRLAQDLARNSNFMAGEIINAETRLLSYTNVARNEFPRAMQIVIDQSARLGISLEQSAELVGRSLQEPSKAMQALGRQGFVLEESQKSLLKQLEATGRTAEAQAIIMDMLAESYGGAAQAQRLGTIAGLWKAIQEQYADFKQDIADRGVLDFFKQQLADLLGVIERLKRDGTLGQWAQRTADAIVNTARAVQNLFRQLAPLAGVLAGIATAIAEHARQVIFLGKVYAALKLAELAKQFSALTRAQLANAAAANAAGTAAAASASRFGLLGAAIGKVPTTLKVGVAILGVEWALRQFQELGAAIQHYQSALQAQERLELSQRDLQREQLALGQQLQQLYRGSADTAIKSAAELRQANREQAESYKFALEQARLYFAGVIREARATGDAQREAAARDQWKALGDAVDVAAERIRALGTEARRENRIRLLAIEAVEEFDKLIAKGETVRKAVDGLFKGIDWTSDDGLAKAADILSQMEVRGSAVAKAVREELGGELKKLSAEDLPGVEAAVVKAFGAGSQAAKAMADAVAAARFDKLGLDLDAVRTGFTKAGREVTNAFADMVRDIDGLGLTAEQKAAAIAQAFDNAFRQASTKAELEALKKSLQDALSGGSIGFVEFQKRIAETDARLAALRDTGANLGSEIARGAKVASSSLDDIAFAAERAASGVNKSAAATGAAGDQAREAAGRTEEFRFALGAMSEQAMQSLADLNRYAGSQLWIQLWNAQMGRISDQYDALKKVNEELDAQAAKYDPITRAMEELRSQYQYVDDATLRGIAQKQVQAEQQLERRREEARRLREEADRAAEAANRLNETSDAALAKPVEDTLKIEFVAPGKAMATALRAEEQEVVDRLVNAAAPRIMQMIERSRSLSNARSARRPGR